MASKNEELQSLYEIETAASDLAALIDAQRVEKETFELKMADAKEALEAKIQKIRDQWKREQIYHEREVAEQAAEIEKQRQREREEYEYTFARDKAIRENELQDTLSNLEKEFKQKRERFEKKTQQHQTELDDREARLAKSENEITGLRQEVETFPDRLNRAVQSAVEETTSRVTADFEKDKALMESQFEGQKNVLVGQIESLEKLVESQANQIRELSRRHEQAYEKVQDIANRAVAAAKREVYSVPVQPRGNAPLREDVSNGS